jgi:predicted nucleic acid-binding protein
LSTLLLDASVVLAAFDSSDRHHAAAASLLADDTVTLATLDLARYEVTNVAVRAWSSPDAVSPLLAALGRIATDGGIVASDNSLLSQAAKLAGRHSISVYDAAYLAAADAGGRRLVSCDVRDLVSRGLAVLPGDSAPD